jgi:hypothetical protein
MKLQLAHLLVRQLQERLGEPQVVQHVERRGMDRVAAEIAQKIGVLFQYQHLDAGTRE